MQQGLKSWQVDAGALSALDPLPWPSSQNTNSSSTALGPGGLQLGRDWAYGIPSRCPGKSCRKHAQVTGSREQEAKDILGQGELSDGQNCSRNLEQTDGDVRTEP